jgi:hypothetical protein
LAVGASLGQTIIARKCSVVIVGRDIFGSLPKENIKSAKVTVVLPS